MPRLIWVFTGRTCHFVCFVMSRLKCFFLLFQLTGLQRYEEVLSKLNSEALKRSQTQVVPTVGVRKFRLILTSQKLLKIAQKCALFLFHLENHPHAQTNFPILCRWLKYCHIEMSRHCKSLFFFYEEFYTTREISEMTFKQNFYFECRNFHFLVNTYILPDTVKPLLWMKVQHV